MFAALTDVQIVEHAVAGVRCVALLDSNGDIKDVTWPAGYTATSDPLEVRDEAGRVVMREGLRFAMAGGAGGWKPGTPCMTAGVKAWHSNGLTPLDDLPTPWPAAKNA